MTKKMMRWEPFGVEVPSLWRHWIEGGIESAGWLRIEEIHEDGDLVIRAEVPGVDPDEDISVTVTDHVLRIAAKREQHLKETKDHSLRSEFHYGAFSRDIRLPSGVTKDLVKADYTDGILEIRIPWSSDPERETTKVAIGHS